MKTLSIPPENYDGKWVVLHVLWFDSSSLRSQHHRRLPIRRGIVYTDVDLAGLFWGTLIKKLVEITNNKLHIEKI